MTEYQKEVLELIATGKAEIEKMEGERKEKQKNTPKRESGPPRFRETEDERGLGKGSRPDTDL